MFKQKIEAQNDKINLDIENQEKISIYTGTHSGLKKPEYLVENQYETVKNMYKNGIGLEIKKSASVQPGSI